MVISTKVDYPVSPSRSSVPYRQMRREIASEYERLGYDVTLTPPQYKLPKFLRGFFPDFVASRTPEYVVVEIRTPSKVRPTTYWHDLSEVIRAHQAEGWRLNPTLDHRVDGHFDGTSIEDIEDSVRQSESSLQAGRLVEALALILPATEAAMRWAIDANQVDIPDYSTPQIISGLYADGVLDKPEYDLLIKFLTESVVPRSTNEEVESATIEALRLLILRLLTARSEDGFE